MIELFFPFRQDGFIGFDLLFDKIELPGYFRGIRSADAGFFVRHTFRIQCFANEFVSQLCGKSVEILAGLINGSTIDVRCSNLNFPDRLPLIDTPISCELATL